jgi:hypothetical protein
MSGILRRNSSRLKQVRAGRLEELQPGLRDAGFGSAPLRNGARGQITQLGNGGSPAKSVDDPIRFIDLICVHAKYLSRLRIILQAI